MLMLSSVYLAFPLLSCAGKFLAKVTNRESFVVSQNQTKAFLKEGFSTDCYIYETGSQTMELTTHFLISKFVLLLIYPSLFSILS